MNELDEKVEKYFVFMLLCAILSEVSQGEVLAAGCTVGSFYYGYKIVFCFVCQGLLWLKKRWSKQ